MVFEGKKKNEEDSYKDKTSVGVIVRCFLFWTVKVLNNFFKV